MSNAGWFFLIVSWGVVGVFVVYSIYMVFAPPE